MKANGFELTHFGAHVARHVSFMRQHNPMVHGLHYLLHGNLWIVCLEQIILNSHYFYVVYYFGDTRLKIYPICVSNTEHDVCISNSFM